MRVRWNSAYVSCRGENFEMFGNFFQGVTTCHDEIVVTSWTVRKLLANSAQGLIEWQDVPMRAVTWTVWNSRHGLAQFILTYPHARTLTISYLAVLQCYDTVGCVIWPVKSSPKWPIMCRVGRWTLLHHLPSLPVTGTPNCMSWRKLFVVQVSASHTRASKMTRLGTPISDHCGNKIRMHPPAHCHEFFDPWLARRIACHGVNRLSLCQCQACLTL